MLHLILCRQLSTQLRHCATTNQTFLVTAIMDFIILDFCVCAIAILATELTASSYTKNM